jgi:hypothetical protein
MIKPMLMKKILLFIASMLLLNYSQAQHFDWATSGGSLSGLGQLGGTKDIARDSVGNYYVLDHGSVESHQCQGDTIAPFSNQNSNAFIYKFNEYGQLLHINRIGSMQPGTSFTAVGIECDEVGNLYVLGNPNDDNQMTAGNQNILIQPNNNIIVKFDSNGTFEWFHQTSYMANIYGASTLLKYHNQKIYFQQGPYSINCIDVNKVLLHTLSTSNYVPYTALSGPSYRSADVMSNGDIVFVGLARGDVFYGTHSALIVNKGYWLDNAILLKTDANLTIEWLKVAHHGYNQSRRFMPIAIDHNDNIYLGCELVDTAYVGNDTIFNHTSNYNGNGAIMKFDKEGNGIWGKFLSTGINTLIYAMTNTNDSTGIYIGGGLQGTTIFDTITLSNTTNITSTVAYLAKFDYDGNFSKAFIPAPKPAQNDVYALIADGRNGYVIGGRSEKTDTLQFQCIAAPLNRGFYFSHFNDINPEVPTPSIVANDNILTATPAYSGAIQWYLNDDAIMGATNSTHTATVSGSYTVQYKLTTGCADSAMSAPYVYTVIGINNQNLISGIYFYPNPVQDMILIKKESAEEILVRIYNIQGQLVHTMKSENNLTSIPCTHFAPGMYIMEVTNKDQVIKYKLDKM